MDEGYPIRDEAGTIPDISVAAETDWVGWFGLHVNVDRLHVEAEFFAKYDMDSRDENLEPRTPSGKFEDMDWAVDHDWYRPSTHWRGWIPIKDFENEFPTPPFLDFDVPAPSFETMRGLWHIALRYAIDLGTRFEMLENLVSQCARINLGVPPLVRPPAFDSEHFLGDTPFDSEPELQAAAAALRRAIADRMGWLTWFRTAIPQPILQEKLPFILLNQLLLETRIEYRKRGYILRLADSWQEANIPLWLTHKLPILYCWRFEEGEIDRLARMNPKLIAGDASNDRITLHYVEDDEQFRTAARNSILYDDFFQIKVPTVVNEDLSFEMDAVLFIIDFEGWGRRQLPIGSDISVYSTRYFFKSEDGETPAGTPNVIFWRWRKKSISITQRLSPPPIGEVDESFIREMYKDAYAPRRGRRFDNETGLPVTTDSEVARMEPFADHRRDPEYAYSDADDSENNTSSSSNSSMPDLESEESPSLIERLGLRIEGGRNRATPYSTLGNVTSWRNAARVAEGRSFDRGRSPRMIRDNAPIRSARSRSPRRPLARNSLPYDRPLVIFRQKLKDVALYLSHEEPRQPLAIYLNWNPDLLAKGYLRIPEDRYEVRFRYFANTPSLGIRHVSQLLKEALIRRLSFQIAIKDSDLSTFAPRTVSEADRMLGRTIYGPDFTETPFEPQSPMIFAANYIVRIGELLKRPHAPAFIGLGGASSWLAQRWGGDALISRFMRGPSIQTTVFRRGASDIHTTKPKGLVWDQPSAREIDLLFGFVPDPTPNSNENDRWLYPPPHIIDEHCHNWAGEWNWVMDKIYGFITNEIQKVPVSWAPKSRGAWKKWLRTYNGGAYTPANVLTEQHVADIMKGIALAELPPTWNGRALCEIHLPESPDD